MNNSHIFQRMNDPRIVKGYLKMLRECDLETAKILYMRIQNEASDHIRFTDIKAIYEHRLQNL